MFNIYSGLDRGNEEIDDGVNLRLPSGTAKSWGNLDYDVNLMLADKAWDRGRPARLRHLRLRRVPRRRDDGEPRLQAVLRGRARASTASASSTRSVSRFFKIALERRLADHPDRQRRQPAAAPGARSRELDEQGIAERYDIVIDFSRYTHRRQGLRLVEPRRARGRQEADARSVARRGARRASRTIRASAGSSSSASCAIRRRRTSARCPATLIPNPDLSAIPVARERALRVRTRRASRRRPIRSRRSAARGASRPTTAACSAADYGRISAAPKIGHARDLDAQERRRRLGSPDPHPLRGGPDPRAQRQRRRTCRPGSGAARTSTACGPAAASRITMQFRDWGGMFMEHCHNTVHEDNAMLLRWDIDADGDAVPAAAADADPDAAGRDLHRSDDILPTACESTRARQSHGRPSDASQCGRT